MLSTITFPAESVLATGKATGMSENCVSGLLYSFRLMVVRTAYVASISTENKSHICGCRAPTIVTEMFMVYVVYAYLRLQFFTG